MSKLVRKIVTLAPVAYGLLQSPAVRSGLSNALRTFRGKLEDLDGRHSDPTVGTLTGKPLTDLSNPKVAKLEEKADKLPGGVFLKAAQVVHQAEEKLAEYDRKVSRAPKTEDSESLVAQEAPKGW